jgi:hypothetical protein
MARRLLGISDVKTPPERRISQRFSVELPMQFRVSQKGTAARWVQSATLDMSSSGVSFRGRRQLPVGSHVELVIEWPALHDEMPMEMHATGLIVRSNTNRTAVRITSRRFCIVKVTEQPIGATA